MKVEAVVKMRKFLTIVLTMCLLMCLTACGGEPGESSTPIPGGDSSVTTTTTGSTSSTAESTTQKPSSTTTGATTTKTGKTTTKTGKTTATTVTTAAPNKTQRTLWVCSKSIDYNTGRVMDDFVDQLTDESNWPNLLARTKVLKLYIQQMYTTPDEDMKRIADFVRKHDLEVAVELGGIRMAPADTPKAKIPEKAFNDEYRHLKKFIDLGGRVDYVTTDHSLAASIAGRAESFPDLKLSRVDYMRLYMQYYQLMQEHIPGVKLGAIESLGFFRIKGAERQYEQTDSTLPVKLDFETYLQEMLVLAKEYGVKLDHFHIDFGYHEVKADGDWGRVLATEELVRSKGLDCGMIVTNAFHLGMAWPSKWPEQASKSAYSETMKMFEGYMQAGGKSSYLMFQRWQQYPVEIGSEAEPYTCMGIFKALLDSPYYVEGWPNE